MRRFRPLSCLAALPMAVALSPAFANPEPLAAAMPVSPGAPVEGAVIENRCPTFSWGAAAGTEAYELAIFDARYDHRADYGIQMARGAPLLLERISAPALSGTPGGMNCLEESEGYLWFVRPLDAEVAGDWSEGMFFRVELAAMTEVVRREVEEQLGDTTVWRDGLERLRQEAPETYAAASQWMAAATSPRLAEVLRPQATTAGSETDRLSMTSEVSETDSLVSISTEVVTQAATFPNPAAFRVARPGGVLFHGSQGGIPAEGAGTRMMWFPGKAAFRAGAVGVNSARSNAWDDNNVGLYSVATGVDTIARGTASTAMGASTTAMGDLTTAIGSGSTAMGRDTIARGTASTAMGASTTASGDSATAMGNSTTARAYASLVLGQ